MPNKEKIDICVGIIQEFLDRNVFRETYEERISYIFLGFLNSLECNEDPIEAMQDEYYTMHARGLIDDFDEDLFNDMFMECVTVIEDVESWNESFGVK